MALFNKIKEKPYKTADFQSGEKEALAFGKKMALVSVAPLPSDLKKTKISYLNILGEILTLLRPLMTIIAIRAYGQNSYKAYFLSFLIDLVIIFILQRNIKLSNNL